MQKTSFISMSHPLLQAWARKCEKICWFFFSMRRQDYLLSKFTDLQDEILLENTISDENMNFECLSTNLLYSSSMKCDQISTQLARNLKKRVDKTTKTICKTHRVLNRYVDEHRPGLVGTFHILIGKFAYFIYQILLQSSEAKI